MLYWVDSRMYLIFYEIYNLYGYNKFYFLYDIYNKSLFLRGLIY